MKVCKKCKKQVANKSKICKYCGSDVSKAKIIKTEPKKIEKPVVIEQKEVEIKNTKQQTNKSIKKSLPKSIEPKKIKKNKTDKKQIKKIIKLILLIIMISALTMGSIKAYKVLFDVGIKINPKEEHQLYNINDVLEYNNILYKITKVETNEKGTQYKKPKKGNHYVVVTIQYKNKSNNAIRYSAKSWKMEDEDKEESSRIFTPLDIKTALYGGKLVIGSTKIGTLVFEEPKTHKNLKLNFYDLKLDEVQPKEEQQEEPKLVFSINIQLQ